MNHRIDRLDKTVFEHLEPTAKELFSLELWYGPSTGASKVVSDLFRILSIVQESASWRLSCFGALNPEFNAGMLATANDPDRRVAFALSEVIKRDPTDPPPNCEIRLAGDIDEMCRVVAPELRQYRYDTYIGGWLTASNSANPLDSKFRNGRFKMWCPGVLMSFCTRHEFVGVDFFAENISLLIKLESEI